MTAIHDPQYNVAALQIRSTDDYITWCRKCMSGTYYVLDEHSSFYVWLGADQNNDFQTLPE